MMKLTAAAAGFPACLSLQSTSWAANSHWWTLQAGPRHLWHGWRHCCCPCSDRRHCWCRPGPVLGRCEEAAGAATRGSCSQASLLQRGTKSDVQNGRAGHLSRWAFQRASATSGKSSGHVNRHLDTALESWARLHTPHTATPSSGSRIMNTTPTLYTIAYNQLGISILTRYWAGGIHKRLLTSCLRSRRWWWGLRV